MVRPRIIHGPTKQVQFYLDNNLYQKFEEIVGKGRVSDNIRRYMKTVVEEIENEKKLVALNDSGSMGATNSHFAMSDGISSKRNELVPTLSREYTDILISDLKARADNTVDILVNFPYFNQRLSSFRENILMPRIHRAYKERKQYAVNSATSKSLLEY